MSAILQQLLRIAQSALPVIACMMARATFALSSSAVDSSPTVQGIIIFDAPVGGMKALHLPEGEVTTIIPSADATTSNAGAIHNLAGPDGNGEIVYAAPGLFSVSLKLRTHDLESGTDRRIPVQQRKLVTGSLGLARFVDMTLSNTGSKVALIRDADGLTVYSPPDSSAYFEEGSLTSLDITSGVATNLGPKALGGGIAWVGDTSKIAYVRRMKLSELPTSVPVSSRVNPRYVSNGIAVVRLLDIETKEDRMIGPGRHPVASPDGKTIYYKGPGEQPMRAQAPDWAPKAIQLPDGMYDVLFATSAGQVVGWGEPDPDAPAKYTDHNSPLVGRKRMLTLRAGSIGNRESTILMQYVDPRRDFSGWIEDGPA